MARIHLLRLIAIVPVLVAAIVNTGYQYLVAVDLNGGAGAGDWRERVTGFLKLIIVIRALMTFWRRDWFICYRYSLWHS